MARSRAFYRAQGKHSWIITLIAGLLVALILLALWLFYDLQRYIVYDKDTLRLVLPKDRAVGRVSALRGISKISAPKTVARIAEP